MCVAVAALPVSITAMDWALGAALAAVLIAGLARSRRIRFPPLGAPLLGLLLWTSAAIALSGAPLQGMEGIRKFYLFGMLLIVAGTVEGADDARTLVWVLASATAVSAGWSLVQFARKYQEAQSAGVDFRLAYTAGERITGFTGHWMTLSGIEMIVLLLCAALLLSGKAGRSGPWLAGASIVIAVSLAAGYTRSMWMGAVLGGCFLLWRRHRRWLIALPVLLALVLILNPAGIGGRVRSAWRPAGDVDSNRFREICRVTGVAMIRAHPWFGLGPGQVRPQFMQYIPPDVRRPLPPGAYIHLHNTYLQFAAERGLPALAFLLWLLGKMMWDLWRALGRDPDNWVLRGALAAAIAVLAAGWYEHNLGNGQVLPLFLAAVGCGYACAPVSTGIK